MHLNKESDFQFQICGIILEHVEYLSLAEQRSMQLCPL